MAFAWSYIPFAEKFYKDDPEGKARLLTRHSQFYNTEPQVGTVINGIVAALEEGIALGDDIPEEMPTSVKTALMGPLAGLGDSVIQGIIVPTLLSIGMSLSSDGSVAGPIFYIVTLLAIGMAICYGMFRYGYKMGLGAIDNLVGEKSMRLMDAINVLGHHRCRYACCGQSCGFNLLSRFLMVQRWVHFKIPLTASSLVFSPS